MFIKLFAPLSEEHRKLQLAADMLTLFDKNGKSYSVQDTYFDAGRDWMWTTIIVTKANGDTYQIYPVQQERFLLASSPDEFAAAVRGLLEEMT